MVQKESPSDAPAGTAAVSSSEPKTQSTDEKPVTEEKAFEPVAESSPVKVEAFPPEAAPQEKASSDDASTQKSAKDAAHPETPADTDGKAAEVSTKNGQGASDAPSAATPEAVDDVAEPQTPPKKRSIARTIFRFFVLLIVLGAVAAGLGYQMMQKAIHEDAIVFRAGSGKIVQEGDAERRVIDLRISQGDTMRSAVLRLQADGMDLSPWLMRAVFRMHEKAGAPVHQGLFRFPEGVTHWTIVDILTGPPLLNQSVRIPDGAPIWEVRRLFRNAAEMTDRTESMSDADLAKAVGLPDGMSPEGWFAPDTYRYSDGTDDLRLLRQAYRRQRALLDEIWATRPADTVLQNEYEALILASIIEKETSHGADRTTVSSVFHNRLRRKMPLQTDPTVIYGIGPDFNGNLTRADLRRPTPYNTYTMNTLPSTPIAMPTRASIEAAVHPAKTDYLYFVARGDGTSAFSKTLAEHNRAVRRFILKKPAQPTQKKKEGK